MYIPLSFMCTCYLPRILPLSFPNNHLVTTGPLHEPVYKFANINVNFVFPHTMAHNLNLLNVAEGLKCSEL